MTAEEYSRYEDEIDAAFIRRVQAEVTQSCALPFAVPIERIPEFIIQAAEWFWLNSDMCSEERMFVIKNSVFCKNGQNKLVVLPNNIIGVCGVYKTTAQTFYGAMGDFSIERMLMTSYSQFGGVGTIGGGLAGGNTGYNLSDVITSMYEIDTFNQYLNAPLTYDYNIFSHKLVILGDLKYQDILLDCYIRCKIQDLYNNHYFFRYVVCLVKRALTTVYGTFEFKLPGGVTINASSFAEAADNELEKIEEWVNSHNSVSYFLQPNTI